MKLNGNKTYIVGMALILFAVGGFVAGKMGATEGIETILLGLGMMGLRHGVGKKI